MIVIVWLCEWNVSGWLFEYSLVWLSGGLAYFTIISPCLCRHMCLWRVHLLWCGSLRRLGWHPWRELRVWREKLLCHVRQILGWFMFRYSTSWNISVKLLILIITFVLYLLNLYPTCHSGSVFLKKRNVEMVSFGFIKPPQKEMVHIPKSSSENTDIAEKEDRVELFDIRSLHLYVISHKHRPRGLSWAEEQQKHFNICF